VTEFEYCH